MAYTAYLSLVQELFIGYYQRPAGPVGLVFWAKEIDAAGGDASAVVDAFANSPESQELYGPINSSTIAGVVTQVFNALFNRNPSQAGLDFYVNGFNGGTFTPGTIVLNIIDGASGIDRTTMDNKLLAADTFTETIDPDLDGLPPFQATYSGDSDALFGRQFLAGVSSIPESIPTPAETAAFIRDFIANPGDPILDFSAILTPGVDNYDFSTSLAADRVQGIQEDAPAGTLTNGDVVKGNGSTELDLIAAGGPPVFATLTNFDRIDIIAVDDTTIDAVGFSNIGAVNVTGGSNGNDIFVEDLDPGTPITITGVTGTISASYDIFGVENDIFVFNANPGTMANALLDADGNVTLNVPDDGSGEAQFWDGPVELGTINVTGGDDVFTEVELGFTDAKAESVLTGNVTAEIGDRSEFFLDIASSGDVTIGNVDLLGGSGADVDGDTTTLDIFAFASGDTIFGNISMEAGDFSKLDVFLGESKSQFSGAFAIDIGNITVGDVSMVGGFSSSVDFFAGAFANAFYGADAWAQDIEIGNITQVAGASSSLDIVVGAEAKSEVSDASADVGLIELGNINMTAGGDSFLMLGAGAGASASDDATADVDGITIGDVNMAAGSDSFLGAFAGAVAGGDFGMLTAGESPAVGQFFDVGSADYAYATAGTIDIGNINMAASGDSELLLMVGAEANGKFDAYAAVGAFTTPENIPKSITIGDINMDSGGADSTVDLFIGAHADSSYGGYALVGDIEVGNISMKAGDNSGIMNATIGASAEGYTTASADVGNIEVGNISMEMGSDTLDNDVTVGVDLFVGATATGVISTHADVGNIEVGDVDLTVGSGHVISPTETDFVFADVDIGNSFGDNGENVTVGDITVNAGDFASITVDVWNYNSTADTAEVVVGDVTVGTIGVTAGTSADVEIFVTNSFSGPNGTVGNLTVGGVDVLVEQDSDVDVYITHKNTYDSGDVGNLSVGNIDIVTGDNLEDLDVDILSSASDGNAGTMTVGDISIAASATTTEDLSGFSFVTMTIDHFAFGSHDLLGAQDVGNISVSVGDESGINLYMDQKGEATLVGDYSIGAVDLVAGDSSDVVFDVDFSNSMDNGNLGNFELDGFSGTVGKGSNVEGFVAIQLGNKDDHDLGNVSIGLVSLDVGENSLADFTAAIYLSDGDAGNLSFGDQTIVAGKSADVDVWEDFSFPPAGQDVFVAGEIASIGFGNFDFTVGADADVYWQPDILATDDIGDVNVGNISVDLTGDGFVDFDLNVDSYFSSFPFFAGGHIGDITVGNIDIIMAQSADFNDFDFEFLAKDDIGLMKVGNISVDAGVNSVLDAEFEINTFGDAGGMTVGTLSVTAEAGANINYDFQIGVDSESGAMTADDITLTGVDATVTADMVGIGPTPEFVTADIGKHFNGAVINLDYTLSGSGSFDLTVGDVTVNLDTLSKIEIDINNGSSGDVFIGDLTVSGAVGAVTYAGAAPDDAGFFNFGGAFVSTHDDISIGNVDYSGYTKDAVIDLTWTQLGAATIIGSPQNDTINGNDVANIIWGGKGQDDMWGNGGIDTFAFINGDSEPAAGSIDAVMDFGDGGTEFLKFGLANGTDANYREDTNTYTDIASFLDAAADALDNSVRYFAAVVNDVAAGPNGTFVAVNYGSGEADLVVDLAGKTLNDISPTNIVL